jgi:hypothetical protein
MFFRTFSHSFNHLLKLNERLHQGDYSFINLYDKKIVLKIEDGAFSKLSVRARLCKTASCMNTYLECRNTLKSKYLLRWRPLSLVTR